jgi:hypothetical protein
MTCSVFSENAPIVLAIGNGNGDQSTPAPRSALQNPDVSRFHLTAMLRRQSRAARPDSRHFWSALMTRCIEQSANANG